MKIARILLFVSVASAISIINLSCDDSGIYVPKYSVNFSYQNMKHLDPFVNGRYEAWISFPPAPGDNDSLVYVSCGRFNIDASTGGLIDSAGNPVGLKLKYIPSNVNSPIDGFITIEPPSDTDTLPSTILIGGAASVNGKVITANMDMRYSGALGSIAESLPNANARYVLDTPTDTGRSRFYQGLWFCDTTGSSLVTIMPQIPENVGWTYEAWIFDKRDSANYTLGKFSNPYSADNDGAGPYKGPVGNGYDKPGQDVLVNAPPALWHLGSWYYGLMITLEPKNEQVNSTPFYIRIFYINTVQNILTRGTISDYLPNAATNLPSATIQISKY